MLNTNESWDGKDYQGGGAGWGCILYIIAFVIIILHDCSR